MSLISDLAKRVAALEKLVQTPRQTRRRLKKRQVAVREGVSTRTVDRRVAKRILPPPDDVVDGRCYWWEDTLDAFDAERLQQAKQITARTKAERRKRMEAALRSRWGGNTSEAGIAKPSKAQRSEAKQAEQS
jgi:hypothetical protein